MSDYQSKYFPQLNEERLKREREAEEQRRNTEVEAETARKRYLEDWHRRAAEAGASVENAHRNRETIGQVVEVVSDWSKATGSTGSSVRWDVPIAFSESPPTWGPLNPEQHMASRPSEIRLDVPQGKTSDQSYTALKERLEQKTGLSVRVVEREPEFFQDNSDHPYEPMLNNVGTYT